jgi:glycosyltransferase involved in cell wall biosynthesis
MKKPLVSIITPSFNQGVWLEKAIQSVLCQTYPNIEYIIIDGGSNDGSKEIIEQNQDKLAYWQSKPDKGQTDALNIGFSKAKGDLIAYLNADDLYFPTAVEGIVNAYEVNQEFGIYYGLCRTIDSVGTEIEGLQGDQTKFNNLVKNGMLPYMFQPACFFNKQYLTNEDFVNPKYKYAFDFDLILSLAKTKSVLFLNREIASYRVHDKSKSYLHKIEAYKEKLSIQEKYNSADFLKLKWKRLKLVLAQQTGKIVNGSAAL